MQINIWHFLIVCPLLFLAGFVDAIAGGGGLISLPAYLIAGFPTTIALGSNKMSALMGTSLSTYKYYKSGFINLKIALPCVFFALFGSTIGARIALLIDDKLFKIIMLFVIPLTLIYISKSSSLKKNQKEDSSLNINIISIAILISFFLGIYDGVYGPGTGTFLIIMLTSVVGLSLNQSNGVAKAINLSTNLGALLIYIINGKVLFQLALTAGVFNMLGAYLGTTLFKKKGLSMVKPIMYLVLIIFLVKIILELFEV
ncbi:MAG: TSUP family transporter [Eubacteriales bacterium]|nr:TSUP family transporter [Eubacteriales bacterium]